MEDEYLLLNIDVFDVTGNQAKVRKTLTINGLIDEILREFDDLDRKTPAAYGIFLKGNPKPLERDKTVAQLDLQPRDELEFRYARRSRREPTGVTRRAYLWEEKTRKIFELTWQPALIPPITSCWLPTWRLLPMGCEFHAAMLKLPWMTGSSTSKTCLPPIPPLSMTYRSLSAINCNPAIKSASVKPILF
jgi:hypothetical protein